MLRVQRLSQDNRINQRRAWLLLGRPMSDPVLSTSPPARPLVVVRKSPAVGPQAKDKRRAFITDKIRRVGSFPLNHFIPACNCNGFSNRCFFDKELFELSGHGGHCLDCAGNRDGPNCERCRDNYFQREDTSCIACNCNEIGE
ncbi:laminin subunit [Homalodisca vitripennis]|nr:laminin subunit [Homalodisca vitripennis]